MLVVGMTLVGMKGVVMMVMAVLGKRWQCWRNGCGGGSECHGQTMVEVVVVLQMVFVGCDDSSRNMIVGVVGLLERPQNPFRRGGGVGGCDEVEGMIIMLIMVVALVAMVVMIVVVVIITAIMVMSMVVFVVAMMITVVMIAMAVMVVRLW